MDTEALVKHPSPLEKILLEEVINAADSLIVISDVRGKIKAILH